MDVGAEHGAVLLDRGAEALALGEWNEARRAFAGAAAKGADPFSAEYGLARAELGAGRAESALAWFERLPGMDSERFGREARNGYCEALTRALRVRLAREDLAAALEALERQAGIASCPSNPALRERSLETWLRAAARSHEAGEPEEALRRLTQARASDPGSPRPARAEGRMLLDLGRTRRAIEVLERALALHRGDSVLQELMVEALSVAGGAARRGSPGN